MPRISKKRLNEKSIQAQSTSNSKYKGKKLKSIFERLDGMERRQLSCNTICRNLKTSSSTDSVIYVGSYKLNDNYSIIDLTESMTSIETRDTFSVPKYAHPTSFGTFYTTLVKNANLTSTASTSRLLDSMEGPKSSLVKTAKSTSCLILVNDEEIRNSDNLDEMHSLNRTKKFNSDSITDLVGEDLDIIKHSLEIEDDINIMNLCSPETFLTEDASVRNLMDTYQVVGTDEF